MGIFQLIHARHIVKRITRLLLVPGAHGTVELLLILGFFVAALFAALAGGAVVVVDQLFGDAVFAFQLAADAHDLKIQAVFLTDMVVALGADGEGCHFGLHVGGTLQQNALLLAGLAVIVDINLIRLLLQGAATVFFYFQVL